MEKKNIANRELRTQNLELRKQKKALEIEIDFGL